MSDRESEPHPISLSLPAKPEAPTEARRYVAQQTAHLDMSDSARVNLALLTSELVTNAVLHAGTALELSLDVGEIVRVKVRDLADGEPHITARDVGGWGLRFVDQQSAQWGVSPADPGKVVWFDLPLH